MIISAQKQSQLNKKQIFTNQVNLAASVSASVSYEASKIHISDNFTEERDKFWAFLVKLKLYIEFNEKKFSKLRRHSLQQHIWRMQSLIGLICIFKNSWKCSIKKDRRWWHNLHEFSHYKLALQQAFKVIDEKWVTEWRIHILQQNESVIKYSVKFQCIVMLMKWDNDVLTLQYYWDLKNSIKNEIS
jgi:hypothetical protein